MTAETKNTPSRLPYIALAAILILALVLRIVGLRWGLPNALHSYSYHPDEFLTIGAAYVFIYMERSLNPRFYNYPSLYLYLSALAIAVAFGYGLIGSDQDIYLSARIITVMMAVGAVAATYWAGRLMFGQTAGLLAALVMAIAPLHVQHSHFATVDVPSTLWVALCLGYAALIAKRGTWRDYVLAGVMAGLAGGTKYNAVLIIFAPIAAHLLRDKFSAKTLLNGKLWMIPLCAIVAFIVTTPGSVLYTQAFWNGVSFEMKHASTGHGLVFAGTGNGFLYTFTSSLWWGLGFGLAIMVAIAALWGLWKKNKHALAIIAFILPYYALISLSEVRFARYTLPLYPAIAILIGWLMVDWYKRLAKWFAPSRLPWLAVCILTGLLTLAYTLTLDELFVRPDPRDQAARWIGEFIPKGSTIGLLDYPWYYTPPLGTDAAMDTLPQRQEYIQTTPYKITVLSDLTDSQDLLNSRNAPEWFIYTGEEVVDAERVAKSNSASAEEKKAAGKILEQVKSVNAHYDPPKIAPSCVNGYTDTSGYRKRLPHDMRYPVSVIYVLRRAR